MPPVFVNTHSCLCTVHAGLCVRSLVPTTYLWYYLLWNNNISGNMQDSDPKHTSKKAAELFSRENINWWKTPPESPDLNPIENMWHELKEFIRCDTKPRNKSELISGITRFWDCLVGTCDGSSTANGRLDTDALSKTNAFVTFSYTAYLGIPEGISSISISTSELYM